MRPLRSMGARPDPASMRRSARFDGRAFHNTVPETPMPPDLMRKVFREMLFGKEKRRPRRPVPVLTPEFGDAAPGGLSAVWLGHASTLVEIEGYRVLVDPVWSLRCSPSRLVGPRRLHPMPLALGELPRLDAVVISHDHYDHLDMATIIALARTRDMPFVVPLGVGAHLRRWRVPASRIAELDWNEQARFGALTLTATEARHFSGRGFTRNDTLWGSWVIAGRHKRVFYTGDTGYFPGFREIGARHGPFDLTLVQIGAYSRYWPDIHMTPEEAVKTHLDVGGGVLLPVHWATFNLALHSWTEPVDRIMLHANDQGIRLAVPRPGERVEVEHPTEPDGWWRALA